MNTDEYDRFLSDHPGHPLGPGMPLGSSLRGEVLTIPKPEVRGGEPTSSLRGESHLMAWERICRGDPCAYCGRVVHHNQAAGRSMLGAGTVDHIEPKTLPVRGHGSAYCWINVAGACESCNNSKGRKSLLQFLTIRAHAAPRRARQTRETSARNSRGSNSPDRRRLLVSG